jgi:hypothetical protein
MAAEGLAVLLNLVRAARLVPRLQQAATGLIVVVVTVLVIRGGLVASAIPRDTYQTPLEEAAAWLRQEGLDRGPVYARHIWLFYYLPLRLDIGYVGPPPVESVRVGTVFVWDSKYSDPAGWLLTNLSDPKNGWQSLQEFDGGNVRIFRRT